MPYGSVQPPSFEELVTETPVIESTADQWSAAVDIPSIVPRFILEMNLWQQIAVVASAVALVAVYVWLYSRVRIAQIRRQEEKYFASRPMSYAAKLLFGDTQTVNVIQAADSEEAQYQKRWEHIENYLKRGTVADWRMAIIEADIMLDELLTSLGYEGGSVGEKLKQVRPEQLRSIEEAWEAHKLRNKIAHEGMQAELTEREVKRAMHQYRTVFREAGLLP